MKIIIKQKIVPLDIVDNDMTIITSGSTTVETNVPSGSIYPIEVQATSNGQTMFTLNVALQSIVMLVKGNGAVIVSSKRSVSGTIMSIDPTANIINGEILVGWGVTQ